MANDKKLLSALVADAAIGLPKSYGTDLHSMLSIPTVTSSTIPSSTIGRVVSMAEHMTSLVISPTMRNTAGMIGIGLCIKTYPLLRDLCETASTLEKEKVYDKIFICSSQ